MAPKKKSNKKGNDDWEAELGEAVDSTETPTLETKNAEAVQNDQGEDDGVSGGGGLLAALKKNKSKKQKKGKVVEEDYLDGEDFSAQTAELGAEAINGVQDLAAKAPEEATTDDLFSAQITKGKGAKGKQGKGVEASKDGDDGSDEEGGTLKSKKEKEKEKKEREKQRKKEQVIRIALLCPLGLSLIKFRLRKRKLLLLHPSLKPSRSNKS